MACASQPHASAVGVPVAVRGIDAIVARTFVPPIPNSGESDDLMRRGVGDKASDKRYTSVVWVVMRMGGRIHTTLLSAVERDVEHARKPGQKNDLNSLLASTRPPSDAPATIH